MTASIDFNIDYYKVLNVKPTSTIEQIKKQYKKLALKHHPDKGGKADNFRLINEAYTILSDESTRSIYNSKYKIKLLTKSFALPITFKESITGIKVNTHIGIIDVPAGTNDGDKLPFLDNIIEIKVEKDPNFKRDKNDLYTNFNVSSLLAITGGTIPFLNADGETINLNIPTLMKGNTVIRVVGKGVKVGNAQGDLFIRCIIETPELTDQQIAAIMSIINQ